jgi:hypothetical protein
MRSLATSDSDLLPAGQIRFYQACLPPLQSESYLLTAEQVVLNTSPSTPLADYNLPAPQPFTIYGPRFTLLPTDVQMVFPPASQQGSFYESLPHVVLAARDLPWSRAIDPTSATPPPATTPWLALLTVYATSEMAGATPLVSAPQQITVQQLVSPPAGTLGPNLGTLTSDELATNTLAFDVDAGLFAAIAPSQAELPFLAHAREVDTSAKETSGGVQAGFYSVVIGNRLPDSVTDGNRDSYAFLVSLEGHWDHLAGGSGVGSAKTVRLVVFASWHFTSTPNAGDFVDIMQQLPNRGGVALLTMPYDTAPSATTPEQLYAKEALDLGYCALADAMRDGEQTTSWFRGPLAPYSTATDPYGPYVTSDAAIRYDPVRGLFDRSYATAWQIGRLLALSDGGFTSSVMAWRQQIYQAQQQAQNDVLVAEQLGFSSPRQGQLPAPSRKRRQHELLLRALRSRFGPALKGAVKLPLMTPRRHRSPGAIAAGLLTSARDQGLDLVQALIADRERNHSYDDKEQP